MRSDLAFEEQDQDAVKRSRGHRLPSLVGSVVDGRYLVERLVGSGGFGLVYRATHLRFDSAVALKVLRISPLCSALERERFVARFAAEGRLAFNLGGQHPGIVRVFETGTIASKRGRIVPYLAMEWLDGVTLTRFLSRRRALGAPALDLGSTLDLLDLAARGLSAAHRSRVAHCDVKPGNLFVFLQDGLPVAKLLDFGLAEVVTESVSASGLGDRASPRRGFTPAYAAPEQWVPALGRTGPWTDVHALALVCTELLCARRPFDEDDPRKLKSACLDVSLRPTPRKLGADVPEGVDRVFEKALSVSPTERFHDAAEFWSALRGAAGISTSAAPSSESIREIRPHVDALGLTSSEEIATSTASTYSALQREVESAPALSADRSLSPRGGFPGSALAVSGRALALTALASGCLALAIWVAVWSRAEPRRPPELERTIYQPEARRSRDPSLTPPGIGSASLPSGPYTSTNTTLSAVPAPSKPSASPAQAGMTRSAIRVKPKPRPAPAEAAPLPTVSSNSAPVPTTAAAPPVSSSLEDILRRRELMTRE